MSIKLAVLVSGRGSNLRAILDAIASRQLDASVEVVIANRKNVGALDVAREHGVPAVVVESRALTKEQHEDKLVAELERRQVELVVLAGYMRVLSARFLNHFFDASTGLYSIVNIHPSYLPAFPGANAYEDAFNAGVTESGITVHLVDEQVDHGPILSQVKFARLPDDSLQSFKDRGLAVEHQLYPAVLQKIAHEGLQVVAKEAVKQ